MNGIHDLGGMHGFGPVAAEPDEPVFHADWEPAVLASMMGTLRLRHWSLDEFRRSIEVQAPVDYLRRSYYEKWLVALERLVVEHGLVTPEELATGQPVSPGSSPAPAGDWRPVFEAPDTEPVFGVGQRVRAVNRHPHEHTRQPRYIRGRSGTIVRHVGGEPLPEKAAQGVCEPEHVYLVRFEACDLWGDKSARDAVYLELWESYLEPAA